MAKYSDFQSRLGKLDDKLWGDKEHGIITLFKNSVRSHASQAKLHVEMKKEFLIILLQKLTEEWTLRLLAIYRILHSCRGAACAVVKPSWE